MTKVSIILYDVCDAIRWHHCPEKLAVSLRLTAPAWRSAANTGRATTDGASNHHHLHNHPSYAINRATLSRIVPDSALEYMCASKNNR